jgi:hypothetical protein
MNRKALTFSVVLVLSLLLGACNMLSSGDTSLEGTRVALAVQQTSLALSQAQEVAVEIQPVDDQPQELPTYTPYPTYTSEPVAAPPTAEAPTAEPPPTEEAAPAVSFEDWMKDANILVYDAMYGRGDTLIIQTAIDGLGLGRNVTHVNDAIGDFIKEMNSAMNWDLIIVGSEFRSQVQGEVFDILVGPIDRGSAVIIETWYIDQVYNGRIRPVMQRCGIAFHQDWWRNTNYRQSDLNNYFVYLLEPNDPVFSSPNIIGPLSPYGVRWVEDVGDTVETIPGSGAVLLAGRLPKEYNSYGLIAKCLEGRLIWQTFSTHDYKDQEMINLWQNYIYNTLKARYDSLQ